jgi:glutathione synthase
VLFDGEPIGAVLRVPARNEARGNLHVGGKPVRTELDDDDRAIIRAVAPVLREYGQLLVGLDVIGGKLTELNITSPTGIRHIEELEQKNVAAEVIAGIERLAAPFA